jgi:hypothetical protein
VSREKVLSIIRKYSCRTSGEDVGAPVFVFEANKSGGVYSPNGA